MTKRTFIKMQPQQWVAAFVLAALFVTLAVAITEFTPQNQPTGYVAQPEMTSFNLASGTETIFRPEYEKKYWSGNLYAYPVSASGNLNFGAEKWTDGAAYQLDKQNYDTGRLIATMRDDGVPVPFRSTSLSAAQQGLLVTTINSTAYSSAQIVDFLRGARTSEGATTTTGLRKRSDLTSGPVLGGIIHSRPRYVADTSTPTVFVGADDGMLHAINALTGAERWAYVPSMLLGKMKNLAANPYVHDYYVDGQININTIPISGLSKRVLVGGLGAGGKGLYALDITTLGATTEAEVASKVLWEITPTQVNYASPATANAYANLGYTYGRRPILKVRTGTTSSTYAVITGNGYNDNAGGNYGAYLLVIDASNGQLIQSIPAGSPGTSASPNGIFSPAVLDTNGDDVVDLVYAGDLNGTMWKFDLSSASSSSWSASVLFTTSPAQPITSTPGVSNRADGGFMVSFGTGAVFTDATADTSTYYIYGIWDGAPSSNTTLLAQGPLEERLYTYASTTTRVRRITDIQPNWASGGHKGWRVALPAGERVTGEGSFSESGRFYFNSHNPTISYLVPSTTTTVWGENWLMELNSLNGGSGSSTDPFFDMDANLQLNNADRIKYTAADTLPTGKSVGDPIISPNEKGIPVGKWISRGVQSQPLLPQLETLNTTFFNQNPDIYVPPSIPPTSSAVGVAGGHFDEDVYYAAASGGTKWSGSVVFDYGTTAKNVTSLTIKVGTETIKTGAPGSKLDTELATWVGVVTTANYTTSISTSKGKGTVTITANAVGAAYNGTITVTATGAASVDYAITNNITTGTGASSGDACTSCQSQAHIHQYDDKYDRTGVNMLNASNTALNLVNAIPSTATNFKVLAQNQYLNPAVKIHIGNSSYVYNVDAGYVSIKGFVTSASLDLATLPTYNRSNVGSLAFNLPVDGLTSKNWWGNGDVRAGLHPTETGCVKRSAGTTDGNMYQPINPPANGTDGPGTKGWSTTTTPATATGARHGGALVIQIISASTPNSAIEENVAGRPEYGWRVKSASYATYVLAEYTTFWHHPTNGCYGDAGWSKTPGPDTGGSTAITPAAGSTDPKIGELGSATAGCTLSNTVAVTGNTTTITTTCTDTDGVTTTVQTVSSTPNADGTETRVTCKSGTCTTETFADRDGKLEEGGDQSGTQAKTGRISWHELIRN